MRNKYPGTCYRCGKLVKKGEGHFEKIKGTKRDWRVQHATCAIIYREKKQKEIEEKALLRDAFLEMTDDPLYADYKAKELTNEL